MFAKLEISPPTAPASPRQHIALLAMLSVVAGLVDVTGFLSFDHVFTAHITGNLAMMAVQIAEGGPPRVAQLLSIPVFAATVAVAYLLARRQLMTGRRRGVLLVGQSLLLFLILGLAVRTPHADAPGTVAPAMLAVAAMALQNAFVRVSLDESETTSVMTGNVASAVIALLALEWPGPWTRNEAPKKLRSTLPLVFGFFLGCALAAPSLGRLGPWSWGLPALLSVIVIPMAAASSTSPGAQKGLSVPPEAHGRRA